MTCVTGRCFYRMFCFPSINLFSLLVSFPPLSPVPFGVGGGSQPVHFDTGSPTACNRFQARRKEVGSTAPCCRQEHGWGAGQGAEPGCPHLLIITKMLGMAAVSPEVIRGGRTWKEGMQKDQRGAVQHGSSTRQQGKAARAVPMPPLVL